MPAPFGSISYQRTSLPAPPATVCCVQTAVPPCDGSAPETACVRRASRLSSTLLDPFCGIVGGIENEGTEIPVASCWTVTLVAPPFSCTLNREILSKSFTSLATTQPVVPGSVCTAGTGVFDCGFPAPESLRSKSEPLTEVKLADDGHVVPDAGFLIQFTSAPL